MHCINDLNGTCPGEAGGLVGPVRPEPGAVSLCLSLLPLFGGSRSFPNRVPRILEIWLAADFTFFSCNCKGFPTATVREKAEGGVPSSAVCRQIKRAAGIER